MVIYLERGEGTSPLEGHPKGTSSCFLNRKGSLKGTLSRFLPQKGTLGGILSRFIHHRGIEEGTFHCFFSPNMGPSCTPVEIVIEVFYL